jgi:hypothetical protein
MWDSIDALIEGFNPDLGFQYPDLDFGGADFGYDYPDPDFGGADFGYDYPDLDAGAQGYGGWDESGMWDIAGNYAQPQGGEPGGILSMLRDVMNDPAKRFMLQAGIGGAAALGQYFSAKNLAKTNRANAQRAREDAANRQQMMDNPQPFAGMNVRPVAANQNNENLATNPLAMLRYGYGPEQAFVSPRASGGQMGGSRTGSGLSAARMVGDHGAGQEDNVPAMLSAKEYVFDADSVAALGDGNPDEGARRLDEFRMNLRRHKRSAPASKIPPKAKRPEAYLRRAA